MQEAKLEYVRRGGCVGVAQISILCKTSNFSLIYPEILMGQGLDMLHTMFEIQSIHLQAALWMGMSLSQINKIPSFWEWPPPPLGIPEVPGVYFFPLLLCVGKFFSPEQDKGFFPSHVGQVFFPSMCVEWVKYFFFLQKLPAPPPRSLMVRP